MSLAHLSQSWLLDQSLKQNLQWLNHWETQANFYSTKRILKRKRNLICRRSNLNSPKLALKFKFQRDSNQHWTSISKNKYTNDSMNLESNKKISKKWVKLVKVQNYQNQNHKAIFKK